MTTTAIAPRKALAGLGPPPLKPASFLATVRSTKGNPFEIIPLQAFEQPCYLSKWLLGPVLMVNDPEGVRRVLLDNVANYPKEPLGDEFFSAMFGRDYRFWSRRGYCIAIAASGMIRSASTRHDSQRS